MELIERQEPEMNGGRFNSILHSKNQAHDLLSRCLNRAFRSECSFEHNFCGQMVDASVVGYEKESNNREIAHLQSDKHVNWRLFLLDSWNDAKWL